MTLFQKQRTLQRHINRLITWKENYTKRGNNTYEHYFNESEGIVKDIINENDSISLNLINAFNRIKQ